ncbi:hypothetical protein ACFQGX_12205 [Nonomuraea dietziae]|uniref:hypothetical protein n=1 Tax=Nonomuraea dietziae TaxID=65515 RepID=UPI00360EA7A8
MTTAPARSGWRASTPVSSTATVTPLPLLTRHALAMSSGASCHCRSRAVAATSSAAVGALVTSSRTVSSPVNTALIR